MTEQDRQILEWLGYKPNPVGDMWTNEQGIIDFYKGDTIDLQFLFDECVPKLRKEMGLRLNILDILLVGWIYRPIILQTQDPTEGLKSAICKVIESEVTNGKAD